jgi:glycine cleavage system H protein
MEVAVEPPMVSEIRYKRSRFSTRLPTDRRYTRSHFWLSEVGAGTWRVGLTKFATRMLGDLVEHGFEVEPGDAVSVGETIGWVEGFKAISELYCVLSGEFLGGNPELDQDVTLLDTDPYGKGWLYQVRVVPDPESVDVNGYVTHLDGTIDQMQKSEINIKGGEGDG